MKELTIKHLSAYLPYGVKCSHARKKGNIKATDVLTIDTWFITKRDYFKPILRPLSDLTKEIEHNGEKFVPAAKMITHGFHNSFWYELEKFDYRYLYAMDLDKLLEWHFDIFSLIESGLAISIHDTKE